MLFRRKKDIEFYFISLAVTGALIGFCAAAFFLNPQRMPILWMLVGLATACKNVALIKDQNNKEAALAN
jgi:formate-dependent nitrite reductase membrane component NrfD